MIQNWNVGSSRTGQQQHMLCFGDEEKTLKVSKHVLSLVCISLVIICSLHCLYVTTVYKGLIIFICHSIVLYCVSIIFVEKFVYFDVP